MSVKTAEKLIRAISKEREQEHDTLYCTSDVKKLLKRKMSTGIGSTRSVGNVRIHGLEVREIPTPTNGQAVAIVCEHGEVFPLTKDHKE